MVIQTMVLPEICTVFVITYLIFQAHKWFKLNTIANKWSAIVRYELYFLPIIMLSFLFFNPITQTVRYFLENGPDYSWKDYWDGYIIYTYSWKIYFQYLTPILLIGYISINLSLLKDHLKQRQEYHELIEAELEKKAIALSTTSSPKSKTSSPYLTYLKGRNTTGELDFPINDVYYFTIEDRFYYAELAKGRYLISKTLNELEAELNPAHFLRIKRDYIVNRQAIESYTHWENGKYSIRLNTPKPHTIVIPRTRMQELREWLQQEDLQPLETVS
ncbi:LytTR family DNA-binding domain-containing protein [Spirosoma foliorum]|uniref:LytTR family DNA-binding domain-containing protein n=1 Tax=Spirosoma foliorum TaxID=2710596 RepID=UPI001F0A74B8|nr:LytTR family DNA-binding domain-containing protein [Spirosoma foliorum]